ncbi:MAG: hypothetical protein IKD15_04275, partial [Clostridia bacterium]|nr:hypothetical protein [Clostridia bacterium]
APSTVEKAEEKMEKAGYTVLAYEKKEEGSVGGFIAKKGIVGGEMLTAILFESKDAASDFYGTYSQIDTNAVLDGKWVYSGSEEAVKAFTAMF